MNFTHHLLILLISVAATAGATDLRAYYEEQKAEAIKSFSAPETGSSVRVKLATGTVRSGTLQALNTDSVTVETEIGPITYKKAMIDASSRRLFFADDYAEAIAVSRTKQLKMQQSRSTQKSGADVVHSARVTATGKVRRERNTKKEISEKTNKEKGTTEEKETRITTETQIYNIEIALANTSRNEDTFKLEWYFLCRNIEGDSDLFIAEKGSKEFTIAGQSRIKHAVSSSPVTRVKIQKSGGDNSDKDTDSESGADLKGYIVVARHGDKILSKTATSSGLLKEDWLKKLDDPITSPSDASAAGKKKGGKNKGGKNKGEGKKKKKNG